MREDFNSGGEENILHEIQDTGESERESESERERERVGERETNGKTRA